MGIFVLEAEQYHIEFSVEYRNNQKDYFVELTMTIETGTSPIKLASVATIMLPFEFVKLTQYFKTYATQSTVGTLEECEPFFPLQLSFYCQLLGGEVWQCDPLNSKDLCSEATLRFMLRNMTNDGQSSGYVGAEGRIGLFQIRSLFAFLDRQSV